MTKFGHSDSRQCSQLTSFSFWSSFSVVSSLPWDGGWEPGPGEVIRVSYPCSHHTPRRMTPVEKLLDSDSGDLSQVFPLNFNFLESTEIAPLPACRCPLFCWSLQHSVAAAVNTTVFLSGRPHPSLSYW